MAAKDKAGGKGSGKFKVVLIIIILLILLIGGAISFWWFQLREPGAPIRNGTTQAPPVAQEATNDAADSAPATDIPRPVVNNVALPTVTVNPPDAVRDIQAQSAKIRDAIIILLSSKTYAELSSTEGKMQLKNEVAARLNQILGTPRVVRVYFTDFVVQ